MNAIFFFVFSALIPIQESNPISHRFSQLSADEQLELVADLQAELLASDNIVIHRAGELLSKEFPVSEWHPVHRLLVFDHKEYAPALKLKYKELSERQSKWKQIGRYALPDGIPDERPSLRYDYASKMLLTPNIKRWGDLLNSFQKGSWGNGSELGSRCEFILDYNLDIQKSAAYFAHTYRDRDGNVYTGIRLYDAWNAQTEFGISDAEGIAFLRNVLDEHRIESPIDKRYHTKLYQRISEYFNTYREYHQLHHTLSQLHVNPNAEINMLYKGIRPQLIGAWILMEFDPRRMANYLKSNPTREEFIKAINEELMAITQPSLNLPKPDNYDKYQSDYLNSLAELSAITKKVLSNYGLLGLRR